MLDDCYLDASKVQKFSEEQSLVPMDLQIRPTEASLHLLEFLFQITILDKLVDVGRVDAHSTETATSKPRMMNLVFITIWILNL